jgi:membrane protein
MTIGHGVRQLREKALGLLQGPGDPLDRKRRILSHQVRLWWFCGRKLLKDRLPMTASALSYKTILSLIPVLAIFFLLTNTFITDRGVRDKVRSFVFETLNLQAVRQSAWTDEAVSQALAEELGLVAADETAGPPADEISNDGADTDIEAWISKLIDRTLDRIKSEGAASRMPVTVASIALLLFAGMSLYGTVEGAFNYIWEVRRRRSWLRRLGDFTATLVVTVLFLGVTFWGVWLLAAGGQFAPLVRTLGRLVPLVTSWLVFFIVYKALPNTKVKLWPALVAALAAGTAWELGAKTVLVLYVMYATGATRLYGTLALIPVLMLWFWLTWVVVLFGAELSYVIQNLKVLTREHIEQGRRTRFLRTDLVALAVAAVVGRRFEQGLPPPTAGELSEAVGASESDVGYVLEALQQKELLRATLAAEGESGYQPSRPPETITAAELVAAAATIELSPPRDEYRGSMFRWARDFMDEISGSVSAALGRETMASLARKSETVDLREKR